jgi:hypothetical protein
MRIAVVALLWQLPLALCWAQEETNDFTAPTLDEVIVEANTAAPAVWKVTRADSDHVLWIMAEPPLLPAGVEWNREPRRLLESQSQEIVFAGGFAIVPDGKVGIFRIATLIPAALSARKNPDGKRLQDVLSPEVYARWLVLKQRYLGNDRGIERWRPIFAAEELRSEALKQIVPKRTAPKPASSPPTATAPAIKRTYASYTIKIPPKEMRGIVKQFARSPLDDEACFASTLAFLEALSDHEAIRNRAVAWASGDIATLREIGLPPNPSAGCDAAMVSSEAAQRFEVSDLEARVNDAWLDAIEKGFAANASTLALLPLREVLTDDGRLALLRERGYHVDGP